MGFSRILLKSLLEISFDKKLCLWVNKSSYCSLWGRPGFAQETLCSLERRKCYAELWFTLITWLQQQDGKTFVLTGQGHAVLYWKHLETVDFSKGSIPGKLPFWMSRRANATARLELLVGLYFVTRIQGFLHSAEPSLAKDLLCEAFGSALLNRGACSVYTDSTGCKISSIGPLQ